MQTNGVEIETFADLIEEERRESSSSSDFLASEATGHEELSHSSSESSSPPPSLGWPVPKAKVPGCTSTNVNADEEKPRLDERNLEKQGSAISGFNSLSQ